MKNLSKSLIPVFVFLFFFNIIDIQAAVIEPVSTEPQMQPSVSPESSVTSSENLPADPSMEFLSQSMALSAATAEESPFLGVEEGGTVSGVVEIRPNPDELPGIRKVAYYLNGTKSGKVYRSPFVWGGPAGDGTTGFDTRTIADGDYTLSMAYTDASGDHGIEIHFTVNNASTPPPTQGDPNAFVWGVEQYETVSGTVEILPNPGKLKEGTEEVTWQLNDELPVTVTEEPFIWGGPAGNGTTGFDTMQLEDGIYDLRYFAPAPNGSVNAGVLFVVENDPDTVPPVTRIPPSGQIAGGTRFPDGTVLVDVEERGDLSFLASENALYIENHANPSQPQLLAAVNFDFDPPILDIALTPDGTGVFVLERGRLSDSSAIPNQQVHLGRLWRVDVTNPSAPVRELVLNGSSSSSAQPQRLMIEGDTLYLIFSEEHSLLPCPLDGSPCGIPGDYYSFRDLIEITPAGNFSAERGTTALRVQGPRIPFDYADTPLPSPVAFMSEKDNRYLFVAMENNTVNVYDSALINSEGQVAPINSIPLEGEPVFSLIPESQPDLYAVLHASGQIEIFDVANVNSETRIHSVSVPGATRLDFDENYIYAVAGNESRIIARTSAPPPPTGDSRVLGITEGQTVSGTVEIRPNPSELPGIRKVAYYLNGTKSGKVYQSPFIWGGPAGNGTTGFDTRTLADGEYELIMAYTDASGDHSIPIHFTVDN